MKILSDILTNLSIIEINGDKNISISGVELNSTKIKSNFAFIAIAGNSVDGHKFINDAISKGAIAVIHTEDVDYQENITYVKIKNNVNNVGIIASNFYDNPSQKLTVVGITGTNGKTTIATSLHNLFSILNIKAGLISTVVNKIGDKNIETKLTTPDAIELNKLFNEMVQSKCEFCFMEVSSHAVVQGRIAGIDFDGGIFTNLSHDHLDYHKTFKNYIDAKKLFFDNLKADTFSLTNIDDRNGNIVVQNTKRKITYAVKTLADYRAKIIERNFDSTLINIDNQEVWLQFVGKFNVYNMLAVFAATNILLPNMQTEILTAISLLKPVAGRFDVVKNNGIFAIIDYAHTPDALKNTLEELKDIKQDNQKLITVVGAGGDRDKTKRPEMAKISNQLSDLLILTSDNPRTENPEQILNDMEAGLPESADYLKITDREQAIKTAIKMADKNDIIFIAGKGHENYQEINGTRHHFDDKEIAEKYLKLIT